MFKLEDFWLLSLAESMVPTDWLWLNRAVLGYCLQSPKSIFPSQLSFSERFLAFRSNFKFEGLFLTELFSVEGSLFSLSIYEDFTLFGLFGIDFISCLLSRAETSWKFVLLPTFKRDSL